MPATGDRKSGNKCEKQDQHQIPPGDFCDGGFDGIPTLALNQPDEQANGKEGAQQAQNGDFSLWARGYFGLGCGHELPVLFKDAEIDRRLAIGDQYGGAGRQPLISIQLGLHFLNQAGFNQQDI